MSWKRKIIGVFSVLFFIGGVWFFTSLEKESVIKKSTENTVIWTCAMHPQIKMPEPGKCPICGMTLIPLKSPGNDNQKTSSLSLSKRAKKLAEVRTSVVKRSEAYLDIRMYGKLDYDSVLVLRIPPQKRDGDPDPLVNLNIELPDHDWEKNGWNIRKGFHTDSVEAERRED